MKRLLFIFFIIISGNSYSQGFICDKIPAKNGRVHYEGVVMVDSVPSSILYNNAQLWIGKTFVSPKDVIQNEVSNSLIVVKGIIDKTNTFVLTIQFKDGRYKYEISDFGIDMFVPGLNRRRSGPIESFPLFKDCKESALILFDSKIKKFIADLESGIKTNNSDW